MIGNQNIDYVLDDEDREVYKRFAGYLEVAFQNERIRFEKDRSKELEKLCSLDALMDDEGKDFADEVAERSFEKIMMWDALQRYRNIVTEREYAALCLVYVHEYTQQETATAMKLSVRRVRQLLESGKKRLRMILEV